MAPIPSSDLVGHRQLHERAVAALDRCQESQDIDFKESAPWDSLKWHIVHSVLAMGNLRDGGIILIGVSQRDGRWSMTGIEETHLATYDVDLIIDQVHKYVSPHVGLDIVTVAHGEGTLYLAILVREFDQTPLVCKKNGPDKEKAAESIREGAIYTRPPGKPRTSRVTTAEQLHELLQLAAEKRARHILEISTRVGMVRGETEADRFAHELEGYVTAGTLPVPVLNFPHWRVVIRPTSYVNERIQTLAECYSLVERNRVSLRGWDFPHLSNRDPDRAQGTNWVSSWVNFIGEVECWRLYQSGQFIHFHGCEEAINSQHRTQMEQSMRSHLRHMQDIAWDQIPGYISYLNFLYRIVEVFEFSARLAQNAAYSTGIQIEIRLIGLRGYLLAMEWQRNWRRYCAVGEEDLGQSWTLSPASLVGSSAEHSLTAATWFFERMGWLQPPPLVIRQDIDKFLHGGR
jgi:hypothetical protein